MTIVPQPESLDSSVQRTSTTPPSPPTAVADKLSSFSIVEAQPSTDIAPFKTKATLPADSALDYSLLDLHQPTALEVSCLHKHKHLVGVDSLPAALTEHYHSTDFQSSDDHPTQLQPTTTTTILICQPIGIGALICFVPGYEQALVETTGYTWDDTGWSIGLGVSWLAIFVLLLTDVTKFQSHLVHPGQALLQILFHIDDGDPLVINYPNATLRPRVEYYARMIFSGVEPDCYTFPFVLRSCTKMEATQEGKQVHGHVLKLRLGDNAFVHSSLIIMNAQSGELGHARFLLHKNSMRDATSYTAWIAGYGLRGFFIKGRELFNEIPERDVVSWNAMIAGYAWNCQFEEALAFFDKMHGARISSSVSTMQPNVATLLNVFPAYAHLCALDLGKWLRAYVDTLHYYDEKYNQNYKCQAIPQFLFLVDYGDPWASWEAETLASSFVVVIHAFGLKEVPDYCAISYNVVADNYFNSGNGYPIYGLLNVANIRMTMLPWPTSKQFPGLNLEDKVLIRDGGIVMNEAQPVASKA
ncbi:hypothetical protein Tsubulata_042700 [Turnera subulata]|uniref:Pentatricopeptide repeat-containing protein n=1 Tax=Turnera subulata TaxID=218843 RepID=A0A9Q0GCF7_9ROSI|nr:hypothetical protein Tsubulata_042700 [Turnera subulata]